MAKDQTKKDKMPFNKLFYRAEKRVQGHERFFWLRCKKKTWKITSKRFKKSDSMDVDENKKFRIFRQFSARLHYDKAQAFVFMWQWTYKGLLHELFSCDQCMMIDDIEAQKSLVKVQCVATFSTLVTENKR